MTRLRKVAVHIGRFVKRVSEAASLFPAPEILAIPMLLGIALFLLVRLFMEFPLETLGTITALAVLWECLKIAEEEDGH